MKQLFSRKSPCKDCPYRKDAPLAKWDVQHFKDLLHSESLQFGALYHCHKNDGCVCVGWLMNQDERRFPSIKLRMALSANNITREYMDSLTCKSERFATVEEMCFANFPHEFPDLE